MTPALHTARGLTLAAATFTTGAIYLAAAYTPWAAVPGLYVAVFLTWCARREYTEHARILTRHRVALLDAVLLGELPCCRLAEHSNGQAHGTDCHRPPDWDTVLDSACCTVWIATRGVTHEWDCPTFRTRSSAA